LSRLHVALSLMALALAGAACAPLPQVEAPADYQVIQRDSDGGAWVEVRGTVAAPIDRIEVSVRLAGAERTPWTPMSLATAAGRQQFSGHLRLPQGGWYQLQLRLDGGRLVTAAPRFGVGDLFVLAGQSNATNTGSGRQPGVNDRVAMFDGERWWRAADPMVGVQDRSRDGSPWPVFGDLLQSAIGVPVGLAAVGHGNTLMADWHPRRPPVSAHLESSRYPALRRRLQKLGGARAILWHQGESDAREGTGTDAYVQGFNDLRQALAADTGMNVPWVVARTSFLPGLKPDAMAAIRQAQEFLWREGMAFQGPSTDDMQGNLRARDGLHFSSLGLRMHGERWYAAVWEALYGQSAAMEGELS